MFILVPKQAACDRAQVWVATDGSVPDAAARLVHAGGVTAVPAAAWQAWHRPGEPRSLHHQTLALPGLAARTSSGLELEVDGSVRARARLGTLPAELHAPSPTERPLTFLLGSCYCRAKDEGSFVDRAYRAIPPSHRPDFKILCGDQVYLDSPWSQYLRHCYDESELRGLFLDHYWSTWAGGDAQHPALSALLRDGPNFFTPDDHELWNNAPSRAAYVRNSWREADREPWLRTARSLYEVFQSPLGACRFAVPPLHFYLADTRMERSADEAQFMSPAALGELIDWIQGLPGPGVLVLGQPLFSAATGWRGNLADWGLADYPQYQDLVRALQSAPHSVLVLTGDVHYRRIASARIPGGPEIHEAIASPLALVDAHAGGAWKPAPALFPLASSAGTVPAHVVTDRSFQGFLAHFLILQCSAAGGSVFIQIFCFGVDPHDPSPGAARPVAELRMQ